MAEINLLHRYPRGKRPIAERGELITEAHRAQARQFGASYFDGTRLEGYGGYVYHPRFWTETVQVFKERYNLAPDASILDVGCGKGFLLHDFKAALPECHVRGLDISEYAKQNALEDMRGHIDLGSADKLPYASGSFDLVISINTIHNLPLECCKTALREIWRVAKKQAFITVDAWRTSREKENLLKWNLTALTYMSTEKWEELFREVGFGGDYYWFIAETE